MLLNPTTTTSSTRVAHPTLPIKIKRPTYKSSNMDPP